MACVHSARCLWNTAGQKESWQLSGCSSEAYCTASSCFVCHLSVCYIFSSMFVTTSSRFVVILVFQCTFLWHYLAARVTLKSPRIKPDREAVDCFYRSPYERQHDVSASTLLSPYQLWVTCCWPWSLTSLCSWGNRKNIKEAKRWCCCCLVISTIVLIILLCGLLFWVLSSDTPGWLMQLHEIDIDYTWAMGKDPLPPTAAPTHTHDKQMMQKLASGAAARSPSGGFHDQIAESSCTCLLENHDPQSQPAQAKALRSLSTMQSNRRRKYPSSITK